MVKIEVTVDESEACLNFVGIDGSAYLFSREAFSQLAEQLTEASREVEYQGYWIFDPVSPDDPEEPVETEEGH